MTRTRYLFSLVVAVYNVEGYLPAFLNSLDWQTFDLSKIQIIFIDDCSSDNSAAILSSWSKRHKNASLYQTDTNSGPAAARNLGLEHATGEWVTTADPDDVLARDYFQKVEDFILRDKNSHADILTTRVFILNDTTGNFKDSHPLGYKYRFGDRLVSLKDEPYAVQLGATCFIKRNDLKKYQLRYEPNVKPSFEDAHLISRFLLEQENPIVGLIATAHYYYRKRYDGSSLVQSGWEQEEKYTNQIADGYLDLLQRAFLKFGIVPRWLEALILYDLFWYFEEDLNFQSKCAWIAEKPDLRGLFLDLLDDVFGYISFKAVNEFGLRDIRWIVREAILVRYFSKNIGEGRLWEWGSSAGITNYTLILSKNDWTHLDFFHNGRQMHPEYSVVSRDFFGVPFVYEISFALPKGKNNVLFRGRPVIKARSAIKVPRVTSSEEYQLLKMVYSKQSGSLQKAITRLLIRKTVKRHSFFRELLNVLRRRIRAKIGKKQCERKAKEIEATIKYANSEYAKRLYQNCWIIMDRVDHAGDNGEHFYRFISEKYPDIKCYFLLKETSRHFKKLQQEGFNVLPYGEKEAIAAYLNSQVVISSDAVEEVIHPAPVSEYGNPKKPFVFLQHGVLEKNLSHWLNNKHIDLCISTTKQEYASFVERESPYILKPNEVVLSGLARFDELYKIREKRSDYIQRKRILIMPTWRTSLRDALQPLEDKADRLRVFKESEFYKAWNMVLSSQKLKCLLEKNNLSAAFILHPNMSEFSDLFSLDSTFEVIDLKLTNFQPLLDDAAAFITDISSTAFDAAFVGVPVMYYNFDMDTIFSGKQIYRRGWFDYYQHGLGPVVHSEHEVIRYIQKLIENQFEIPHEFQQRILREFVFFDDQNRQRIYNAVIRMLARVNIESSIPSQPVTYRANGSPANLLEMEIRSAAISVDEEGALWMRNEKNHLSQDLPSNLYYGKITIKNYNSVLDRRIILYRDNEQVFGAYVEKPEGSFPVEFRNFIVDSNNIGRYRINCNVDFILEFSREAFNTELQNEYDTKYGVIQRDNLFFAVRGNITNPKKILLTFASQALSASQLSYPITFMSSLKENDLSETLMLCFQDRYYTQGSFMLVDSQGFLLLPSIEKLLRILSQHYKIAEKNIMFFGASKGGTSALIAAENFPAARLLLVAPQTNLPNYLNRPVFLDNLYRMNCFHNEIQPGELLSNYLKQGRQVDYFYSNIDHHSNASAVEFMVDQPSLRKFRINVPHNDVITQGLPAINGIIKRFLGKSVIQKVDISGFHSTVTKDLLHVDVKADLKVKESLAFVSLSSEEQTKLYQCVSYRSDSVFSMTAKEYFLPQIDPIESSSLSFLNFSEDVVFSGETTIDLDRKRPIFGANKKLNHDFLLDTKDWSEYSIIVGEKVDTYSYVSTLTKIGIDLEILIISDNNLAELHSASTATTSNKVIICSSEQMDCLPVFIKRLVSFYRAERLRIFVDDSVDDPL
ncbi:MAG: CDP-glycerol glycerophosphotransferase family protein, partial [Vagococcus sp.]|nr:CDP-glycerol glycerophosphotransferase family protein [Vagococcus sp.]